MLLAILQMLHGVRSEMATIHLQSPEHFDFKSPYGYPKWKKGFEQFRAASGISTASAAQQVNALLYCLGRRKRGKFMR